MHTDPITGQQYWWDGYQWQPVPPNPGVPGRSVWKTRKNTSHLFHLVMTVLTGGLWALFVWLPIIVWHKMGPRRRAVTYSR